MTLKTRLNKLEDKVDPNPEVDCIAIWNTFVKPECKASEHKPSDKECICDPPVFGGWAGNCDRTDIPEYTED